jgi:hypothetical protein
VGLIEFLRYKLRVFGIPINNATSVFCDNEVVYKNITMPESIFKKENHLIAFHWPCEAAEGKQTNLRDFLAKLLPQAQHVELAAWQAHLSMAMVEVICSVQSIGGDLLISWCSTVGFQYHVHPRYLCFKLVFCCQILSNWFAPYIQLEGTCWCPAGLQLVANIM